MKTCLCHDKIVSHLSKTISVSQRTTFWEITLGLGLLGMGVILRGK